MGYASVGFSGYVPLSYTEIYSYMKATQTSLSPTEVNLIKRLSTEYVGQHNDKCPLSKPPYLSEEDMKPIDLTQEIKLRYGLE
jgi:hypothetical protein